ncbi:putative Adenylate/guanylate cyclase [Candidatus Terasakiella magnetica]|uniref:Putative Adenylate/guanylate cyclase n=1 Tax=Candidatus Terasakiella magnetica TaxID=1867952 RepID=A0A1C3RF57_9PROT|nr:adenylate/guanylate cyclase domain-containing protein [Candidatus Terasakiella magnetica]SCA55899.1 putative Adenylate/guanylate cyclase [Candidatus Terasakiella magnetica]
MAEDSITFEAPYPLQNRFRRIILPSLLFLTVLIGFIMSNGSTWLTEKIYLEISENRAAVIHRALSEKDHQAWENLQVSNTPNEIYDTAKGEHLLHTLRDEVKELGLSHLKVYGQNGLLLYSSEEAQIGTLDLSKGYLNALNGVRTLVEKQRPDGHKLYELYVKVPDTTHPIVMELYEPVDYLDGITLKVIIPATLIPVSILVLLALGMNRLVRHAQADINYRTDLLNEFRLRLQRLVSNEAVETIRSTTGKGEVASRRVRASILFSDVRDFTDFCERETPENVVAFLNQSLGIVIEAVREQGGDVDKMIGDAVLAHFQGEKAEERALKAAKKALEDTKMSNLPRGIGIGIYTGDVVVGTVGATNRMDFTVIGDTVNVASRLCSAAEQGEIVIEGHEEHIMSKQYSHNVEQITVKGREEPLNISRYKLL